EVVAEAGSSAELPDLLEIVHRGDELYKLLIQDPNSAPSLRVEIEPTGLGQLSTGGFAPFSEFPAGSFAAVLSDNGTRLELTAFTQFSFDWDEDGQIEPADGEYTVLDFPMSEASLLRNFAGKTID